MRREREITITRERIKQLLDRHRGRKYVPEDFKPLMPLEEEDVLRLAHRATEPDMVMVPRERIQKCQNELAVEPVDADADWFDERDGMLIDEMNRWLGEQENQP